MSECIKLCCCLIEQVERNERANELQRVHNTMNRVHTQILKREAEFISAMSANLFEAIAKKNIEQVNENLKLSRTTKTNYKLYQIEGLSPLVYVISRISSKEDYEQYLPVLRILSLYYNIDDVISYSEDTALVQAIRTNNFVMVRNLIFFGANHNDPALMNFAKKIEGQEIYDYLIYYDHWRKVRSKSSELPLPWTLEENFFKALDKLDAEAVENLLDLGCYPDKAIAVTLAGKQINLTPLVCLILAKKDSTFTDGAAGAGSASGAASVGSAEEKIGTIIKLLLKYGAKIDKRVNKRTALEQAVLLEDFNWAKNLLKHGARPTETVLCEYIFNAILTSDVEALTHGLQLSKELKIDKSKFIHLNGNNPLVYAIEMINSKEDYVKMFPIVVALKQHYDINDPMFPALYRAVCSNNRALVTKLLFFGGDLEQKNKIGVCKTQNALEASRKLEKKEISDYIDFYLQRQRAELTTDTPPPWTLDDDFISAMNSEDVASMNKVLALGYYPDNKISFSIQGKEIISTPLAKCIRMEKHVPEKAAKLQEIIALLISHGAKIDKKIDDKAALEQAAELGDLEWVKGLLAHGASPYKKKNTGSFSKQELVKTNFVEVNTYIESFSKLNQKKEKQGKMEIKLKEPLLSEIDEV